MSNPSSSGPQQSHVNGIARTDSHGRKPSVVISASGASGQIANGGPVGNNSRPNISFGSMIQGSPASQNNASSQSQGSGLNTPRQDPRVISPAASPSPIPQPAASGGKPPVVHPGQGNGLSFGSMGQENGDARGPLTPGQQPAHLRRESSQSNHSDMSNVSHMGRGAYQGAGRGRGNFAPSYVPHSPATGYRQPNTSRAPIPAFGNPNQMGGVYGGRGRGSPSVMHSQPYMPHGMPNQQMQHGGYQQHPGGQQQQQNMYGMQGQFDPYASYYQPYGYQYNPGAPPSPRPGSQYQMPYGGPPQHMQQPFHGAPSMSRQSSQISERPASSLGSRPPTNASNPSQAPTPAPNATTPAPTTTNFQIPSRVKSKAIVIKNAAGEEITFDKKGPSPSPAPQPQQSQASAPSPAIVSSAPTPPPRTPSVQHNRTESKSTKTSDEIKSGFQEQVKRQLEAQREQERKAKEESEKKGPQEEAIVEEPKSEAKATPDVAEKTTEDKTEPAEKAAEEKSKIEVEAKAEAPKSDAEATSQADNARAVVEAETAAPAGAAAEETPEEKAAREKREEDERLEAEIAEMEAAEREEEERERAYQEKRAKQKEEQKKLEAEKAANLDAELKRQEREAEERELAKEKERESGENVSAQEAFAALKKPTLGPGASESANETEVETPTEDETPKTDSLAGSKHAKPKPGPLSLDTNKQVEAAQPTPGMQALKTARLLDIKRDAVSYPEGIKSPNPALNQNAKKAGLSYDRAFLLQFQDVFKEKPSVDWDHKIMQTLGDGDSGSARGSAGGRTPSSATGRQGSRNGGAPSQFTAMGSFAGGRTLPSGTTSQQRFEQASARPPVGGAMGGFGGGRGGFPMGGPSNGRQTSAPSMANLSQNSPRGGGARGGRGGSRRGTERGQGRKDDGGDKNMPLTAGMELKGLEKSATGWVARSIGQPAAANTTPDGMMAPDMVQRKVKAALNKMTPEKFDKISDQIIEIANQSKSESDGRTLRQVIQLTFEKACDEAHWAGMYAKFCSKMLTTMSNEIVDETVKDRNGVPVTGGGLFRKYLLNRCQEEFERGWEVNLPEKPEGESEEAALLSDEYYIAAAAKRRGLGLIQFIGELYKLSMLTYRIMHQCVLKLLNFEGQPDESAVENLCKLLRTIGATMDNSGEQGHGLVNVYFDRITNILETHKDMPSRPRFMLMDIIDLRAKNWQDKQAQKGPKTIQEIHAEAEAAAAAAEAEKARMSARGGPGGGRMQAGRGDARNFSQGMPPPDYPRNQVEMGDLRRLQNRNASNRQASSGLGPSLGPGSSLYAGRSSSGRKGLGPPKDGDASGMSSRTGTPPIKKEEKESNTHANAFSALAALEGNEGAEDTRSPPSEPGSPQTSKATPSIDAAADSAAPPS
ncbi:hypothetical protein MBLNU457_4954t1 [Dothideomycetes sp. NU457]